MPIYEYECKSCYARFEVKQSITDEPIRTCPECQGEVRRLLHPVGIVFKGSGFYTTDYAKGKASNIATAGESPGKAEAGKAEAGKKEEQKEPAAAAAKDPKTEA